MPKLGLSLAPAGEIAGSGSEGVVVTEIDPDGLASEHGLKSGDVILEVGGLRLLPQRMCVKPSVTRKRTASTPCLCELNQTTQ